MKFIEYKYLCWDISDKFIILVQIEGDKRRVPLLFTSKRRAVLDNRGMRAETSTLLQQTRPTENQYLQAIYEED